MKIFVITKAETSDLKKILELQYLAYQSEAKLLNNFSIPPLTQTYDEMVLEYRKGIILKAVEDNGEIIGSVRAYIENDTAFIGKVIVHPKKQRQGIGTKLLSSIEGECPAGRYELYTSSKSVGNINFYEHNGYVRFLEKTISPGLNFVYLEKYPDNRTLSK